jgi:hypothetical protein
VPRRNRHITVKDIKMSREPDHGFRVSRITGGLGCQRSAPTIIVAKPISAYASLFAASDEASCARLFDMAQRYKAKAGAIEREDAMTTVIGQGPAIDGPEPC